MRNKPINKLGFVSLLALLGIGGIITESKGMLSFFCYIVYIRYFFVVPYELFLKNVSKAASIGFFGGIFATGIAVAIHMIIPQFLSSNLVLGSCFIAGTVCFTVMLLILEIREQVD